LQASSHATRADGTPFRAFAERWKVEAIRFAERWTVEAIRLTEWLTFACSAHVLDWASAMIRSEAHLQDIHILGHDEQQES
jgi:hypothetical protein